MGREKFKAPSTNQGRNISVSRNKEPSSNSLHPAFCFKYIVKKHSLDKCKTEERAALALTMQKLGQKNWGEIQSAGRHGLGHEKIDKNSIKVAVPTSVPKGITLIAFRFSGKNL